MQFCYVSIQVVASQSVAVWAKSVNAVARYDRQAVWTLTETGSFDSA